jgi:hypothetical protein
MRTASIAALSGLLALLTPLGAQTPNGPTRTLRPESSRKALVIGNGAYRRLAKLPNAVPDARRVAGALTDIGYMVTLVQDVGREELERKVEAFADSIAEGDTVFVYVAAHAVEIDGENRVFGVDAEVSDAIALKYRSLSAAEVLERLASRSTGVRVFVLDACRERPVQTRSVSEPTMAAMKAGANTFIGYSTSQGRTASDASGYASALAAELRTNGGHPIETIFRAVGIAVGRDGNQTAWTSSSLQTVFCPGGCLPAGSNPEPRPTRPARTRVETPEPAPVKPQAPALTGAWAGTFQCDDGRGGSMGVEFAGATALVNIRVNNVGTASQARYGIAREGNRFQASNGRPEYGSSFDWVPFTGTIQANRINGEIEGCGAFVLNRQR